MSLKKVVYNNRFGVFSLSPLAVKRYAELCGRPCYFFSSDSSDGKYKPIIAEEINQRSFRWAAFDIPNINKIMADQDNWGHLSDGEKKRSSEEYTKHHIASVGFKRDDPLLVQVVEEMGDKANGPCAELRIATIPTGMKYRIDEYAGRESVMTVNDYDWETA